MYQDMYKRRRKELLKDKSINSKNKEIIEKFLIFEEYKLKRKEGLSEVDERSYKTLYFYISRIVNINRWFKGKAWEDLTKEEIKKVVDDLTFKAFNTYEKKGEYTIAVKVTDVFGNDGIVTTKVVIK